MTKKGVRSPKTNRQQVSNSEISHILALKVPPSWLKKNWASKDDRTQTKKNYRRRRNLAVGYSAEIKGFCRLAVGRSWKVRTGTNS
jgi:hypothetical protein